MAFQLRITMFVSSPHKLSRSISSRKLGFPYAYYQKCFVPSETVSEKDSLLFLTRSVSLTGRMELISLIFPKHLIKKTTLLFGSIEMTVRFFHCFLFLEHGSWWRWCTSIIQNYLILLDLSSGIKNQFVPTGNGVLLLEVWISWRNNPSGSFKFRNSRWINAKHGRISLW